VNLCIRYIRYNDNNASKILFSVTKYKFINEILIQLKKRLIPIQHSRRVLSDFIIEFEKCITIRIN
jgi:hypothetical protein